MLHLVQSDYNDKTTGSLLVPVPRILTKEVRQKLLQDYKKGERSCGE